MLGPERGLRGCWENIFKACYYTSLLFITFGWLFRAGSLYKVLWCHETEQAIAERLCCPPPLPVPPVRQGFLSWEWYSQDVTFDSTLLVIVLWAPDLY